MEKLKKILDIVKTIFCIVFFGISAIFLFDKNKEKRNKINTKSEEKKKEKEDEIKKTDAATLIDQSPNKSDIQSDITELQSDFRKRIRDRLNKSL